MIKSKFLAACLACAVTAAPLAAEAKVVRLVAKMNGASEVDGGDADGAGDFSVHADLDNSYLCYSLTTRATAQSTVAHIHAGAAGSNGPPVMRFQETYWDNDICMFVERDVLNAIVASPQSYYVNVHTTENASGAVRGQLKSR